MNKPMKDKEMQNREIAERLIQASIVHEEDLMEEFGTSSGGLTDIEANKRLEQYGKNQVAHEKTPAWYVQLLACFKNPFILILLSLALFSYIADDDVEAVVIITTMVTVSVIITFTQEFRSARTAEKLKEMVKTTATVNRQSKRKEIDLELLVPGDIIHLSAGDMVPADVRLVHSKDLFVGESALTGEAMPVEKLDTLPRGASKLARNRNQLTPTNALELNNMCYMGTNVISGSASAVVVSTGDHTYFGSMASTLIGKPPLTSFDKGVKSVTFVLIRFMLIMVPVIFLINGFTKGDWMDALFFGLSVAVGLTPEMLPVVVAGNLAKGASIMARNKVVVKRLNSIQNFGAMDILCTDKTGTLTQDKIILERHLDINGEDDNQVLEYAYLNSYHQTGLKNLLDVAVLEHAELSDVLGAENNYSKFDEIPFDFNRRRMSVVLEKRGNGHLLICKGAMEEVLSICSHVSDNGQIVPLTPERADRAQRLVNSLNMDGLRVIAVAIKQMAATDEPYSVKDEQDLILAGYIGFLDPPKETAREAIRALKDSGVEVKIITGDNAAVTRKVCKDVGLTISDIVLGSEIERLTDQQLADVAESSNVFAKVNPMQKARIVRVLKSKGHTVGFMGDGINDAVSLKEADVGISVDTAVDISKESADIILLEKSLMVLERGVIEGRKTFGNMIKYIKMTASSNFGNVFSVLVASAFLPFLPMLPIHLLIQNLFYDISQLSIPWDHMDKEYLRKPRKWDSKSVSRFMIFIGPISSIFDITTYALMWYIFSANSIDQQTLFHSGWFIEGLLSQTLIVHMIRTEKIPFIQSRASMPVLLLTCAIMIAGIFVPFSGFGASLGLQPLPMEYFPWLVGTLLCYCVLTQLVKKWYIRKFNEWL
ncbi:magnesium-translocating P-type ATPase [Paenibacillus sp. MER TA 81-3]|uniref:magnesium-translocating P-type ATPase n=1 Tax=Paenibacillus sp. MER TA 81-3 TaxID=2939573 RepID=UPI00203D5AAF|nr:magnesium-translocating P-type ATPase [Paenibacillus sp. MER TA 81-3]MCM3337508.1 magnesium-translocating P-type ATPase [Paenibacillus sp. MER TA 81-3]